MSEQHKIKIRAATFEEVGQLVGTFKFINGSAIVAECSCDSEMANLERAVVEAAEKWAVKFPAQYASRPEDDDLYFAVHALIAAREKVENR